MKAGFRELPLRVKLLVALQFIIVSYALVRNSLLVFSNYLAFKNPLVPSDLWLRISRVSMALAVFYILMTFVSVVQYRKNSGKGFGKLILITLLLDLLIAYALS